MRIKYPRVAVRRMRARANNARWATPSHVLGKEEAARRNEFNWMDGYAACMRDVQKQLKAARK